LSHGALVAIAFAARHPERVRRLVLVSGYAAGFGVRGDREEIERRETLVRMGQVYRDGDRTVFGRMLGALYWPGARGEVIDWFAERLVTIMGLSEALQDVFRTVDLRPLLPAIRAETLIVHSKGDRIIPHACSEQLAESIADARLISAESGNHMLLQDEAAWPAVRGALRAFLS
jgi:pimeloyl-ACP methyl ester carboxylesterase